MSNEQRGQEALDALDKALKSRDRAEKSKPLAVVAMSAVAILAIVGVVWFLATRDSEEDVVADDTAESTEQTSEAQVEPLALERETPLPETVTCSYDDAGEAAREVGKPQTENVPATGEVTVTLQTGQGPIPMTLDRSVSPCTVNAFVHMSEQGYFNDTVCHRMTSGALNVLQCGDPTGTGSGGPGFQFANEYPTDEMGAKTGKPVTYPAGTVAMANSGPDTNGSQFFLNYDDSQLPPDYTYFGKVTDEGMDTLGTISEAGVEGDPNNGAPAEEVRISEATVSE
ncbi:peptidylprolyl isomerase [Corynebacterium frankenforstense]